ncbi:MAG: translation initiation factor IF-3 [Phycisphaerales bacterium]|nr:MAG: translation initiation factor IF-3 [Phycisphaerales bacterium]
MQRTRVNHMIRISPIRLIGPDNEQVGVVETYDALKQAQEVGLDLVEISPESRPPVCKIMDYGKYKYELSKRAQSGKSTQAEMKEIRLGRSVKIGANDVKIRVDQARRFMMAGHKVQITQRFRGREMMHKELGLERLAQIANDLSDIGKVEMAPRWMGRQASIIIAPDKIKVEAAKRKMTKEQLEAEQQALEEAERAHAEEAARAAAEDHDDDDDDEGGKPKKKKRKGPADDRAGNPVDDEISALLGED